MQGRGNRPTGTRSRAGTGTVGAGAGPPGGLGEFGPRRDAFRRRRRAHRCAPASWPAPRASVGSASPAPGAQQRFSETVARIVHGEKGACTPRAGGVALAAVPEGGLGAAARRRIWRADPTQVSAGPVRPWGRVRMLRQDRDLRPLEADGFVLRRNSARPEDDGLRPPPERLLPGPRRPGRRKCARPMRAPERSADLVARREGEPLRPLPPPRGGPSPGDCGGPLVHGSS